MTADFTALINGALEDYATGRDAMRWLPPGTVPGPPACEGEKSPSSIRVAVARLDPAVLAEFEAEWTAATEQAGAEYSLQPVEDFTHRWWTRVQHLGPGGG